MLRLLCIGYTWTIVGNCLIMIGTIQWLDIMYVVWTFCSFITECFTVCTMGVVSKGLSANEASLSSSEVMMLSLICERSQYYPISLTDQRNLAATQLYLCNYNAEDTPKH